MPFKIKPDDFTRAIVDELRKYRDDVDEIIVEAVDKTAKQTVSTLRKTSPKLTGDYQKGWRNRLVKDEQGRYVKEIYNKTDWQLTHLLEYGHAKTGGGRVPPVEHIEPAERQADALLEVMIKDALR